MKKTYFTRVLFAFTALLGLLIPAASFAQFAPGVPPACAMALQGRIAWDYQNTTTWAPANIERLCRGGARDQPAQCFQRVMHGGVDFGGGARWEWENAINLCQGTRNAAVTVACFQGVVSTGRPWREAIETCSRARGAPLPPPGVQPGVPVQPMQPGVQPGVVMMPPGMPPPVVDPIQACRAALQGRVPWNYEGNTTWANENIERLCRGGVQDQPAQCFQRVMHGGVDFGGGARWEWANAINLCHGSHNAAATVACFQGQVGVGRPWRDAITNCSR